jgi:hypothetical protein
MMVTKLGIIGTGSCADVVALVDGWILRLLISKISGNATINRGICKKRNRKKAAKWRYFHPH